MATLVRTDDVVLSVTLSLSTDQYADGDVLAATQAVANAFVNNRPAILQSIRLLDADDQAGALDLVFLSANVAIGTENSAVSVTDANAAKIMTVVEIAAADYVDMINSQVVAKNGSDSGMGVLLQADAANSLYIAAVSRDTKTYTASGLSLLIGLRRL
jgi:hypothetical protein